MNGLKNALIAWVSMIVATAWAGSAPSLLGATSKQASQSFSHVGVEARSVLFNRDGQLIGFIDVNGSIVDANGRVHGQVHKDGAVTNAQGFLLGKVNAKGVVVDSEGVYVGVIQKNGAAVSQLQTVVGEVIQVAKDVKGFPSFVPPAGVPAPGRIRTTDKKSAVNR